MQVAPSPPLFPKELLCGAVVIDHTRRNLRGGKSITQFIDADEWERTRQVEEMERETLEGLLEYVG